MRKFILMYQVPSTNTYGSFIKLPDTIATVFVPAILRLPS